MEKIEINSKFNLDSNIYIKNKIQEIEAEVKKTIVNTCAPESIILRGSFGRNEVSCDFTNDNFFVYSDCEIVIINPKFPTKQNINGLSIELTKKLQLKVEISDFEPELKYLMKIGLKNKIIPSIDNYELKYGSKIIFGNNFLETLPDFNSQDIPEWEGIRLILNRMIECSYYFYLYCISPKPTEKQNADLFYWINKLILACQDALLISIKKYHYSYRMRNKIFSQIYFDNFSAINREVPAFLPLTIQATNFKLKPIRAEIPNDIVKYWFDVSIIVDIVFRYLINDTMKFQFHSYFHFHHEYLRNKHIKKDFYRGLSPNLLYQNTRSLAKTTSLQKHLPHRIYLKYLFLPWNHIIYSCIPIIYFNSILHNEVATEDISEEKKIESQKKLNDYLSQNDDHYINYLFSCKNPVQQLYEDWMGICY